MKRSNPHPRLFNEVLEAIANLKEKRGSTTKTIMNQVDSILSIKRKQLRNDVNQFYRALQHGINTGLITKKSGKYKLGLRPKDYRVFKDFQRIIVCDDNFRKHRRGRKGKQRRRKRGRRKRRFSIGPSGTDEYNTDCSYSSTSSPRVSAVPEDRGRRRGRKRRGRRRRSGRRSRRGRRVAVEEDTKERVPQKMVVQEDPDKSSNDSLKSTEIRKSTADKKKESERNDRDDRDDRGDKNEADRKQFETRRENRDESVDVESQQHCENPGCLCNRQKSQEGNRSQQ